MTFRYQYDSPRDTLWYPEMTQFGVIFDQKSCILTHGCPFLSAEVCFVFVCILSSPHESFSIQDKQSEPV